MKLQHRALQISKRMHWCFLSVNEEIAVLIYLTFKLQYTDVKLNFKINDNLFCEI